MGHHIINISGIEHVAEYSIDSGDPVAGRIWPLENICCTYIKKFTAISLPSLGAMRINVNYCPVCGEELSR